MTIESAVSDLTTATTTLTTAVGTQQASIVAAVATFAATTGRVNTGLNNVDNTHDVDKPLSTAAIATLATKQLTLVSGVNISTVNGQSLLGGSPLVIARSATSLTSLAYESRGTLRTTLPQPDDSVVIEGLGLYMWVATQLEPDDDETCFNTAMGQWLLDVPAYDLLASWALIEDSIRDEDKEDLPALIQSYFTNRGL